jgi:porphobilinogen synthase
MSEFPALRPRRLRRTPALRRLVRETTLSIDDLIYPIFVRHGKDERRPISSMPGQFQWSVDRLPALAAELTELHVPAVILFGLPATKDPIGVENYAPDGVVQQAIRTLKDAAPGLVVMTDVCACEYTDHGHCGILNEHGSGRVEGRRLPEGYVLNDATLELLQKVVASHAEAGADIVAPSGMMDGAVKAIRDELDRGRAQDVAIMAYAAKFASSFYGPFREAADSPPKFGDRKQYQMDPANGREALLEVALDVAEGADILMVKPALPYLDILHRVRQGFDRPVAAYQVSGEYAMVKAAAQNGWLDERAVALESLTAIKRAGADMILTYWALEAAHWLREV